MTTAADDIFMLCFFIYIYLFFKENKAWNCMWIVCLVEFVCLVDESREMSRLIFAEKNRMSSAAYFAWRLMVYVFSLKATFRKTSLSIGASSLRVSVWLRLLPGEHTIFSHLQNLRRIETLSGVTTLSKLFCLSSEKSLFWKEILSFKSRPFSVKKNIFFSF